VLTPVAPPPIPIAARAAGDVLSPVRAAGAGVAAAAATVSSAGDGKENVATGLQEVRVAIIGNVDSGKSTLVGCLTKRVMDNGRGSARELIFRHKHEIENGRTSSIATEIMGFAKGSQVAVDAKANRASAWQAVHARAERSVTLVDLCGHERYLKTTVFGLTGLMPDYGIIVVGANMGVSRMTKVCRPFFFPVAAATALGRRLARSRAPRLGDMPCAAILCIAGAHRHRRGAEAAAHYRGNEDRHRARGHLQEGATAAAVDFFVAVPFFHFFLAYVRRHARRCRRPVLVCVLFPQTMSQVSRVLRQAHKQPYLVRDMDGVAVAAKAILADRIAPVIPCSSVTGEVCLRRLLLHRLCRLRVGCRCHTHPLRRVVSCNRRVCCAGSGPDTRPAGLAAGASVHRSDDDGKPVGRRDDVWRQAHCDTACGRVPCCCRC
jgi:hypothetical protein